jgi:hypothetical protein
MYGLTECIINKQTKTVFSGGDLKGVLLVDILDCGDLKC